MFPKLMTPSTRKPLNDEEGNLQKAIVQHLLLRAPANVIWYHCPNGGLRSKRTASKLKLQGVRAGVPDLCFVLADGRAAYLELKAPKGRLSPSQIAFQEQCAAMEVEHAVSANLDNALAILTAWGAIA
jgi:hypothetical protein